MSWRAHLFGNEGYRSLLSIGGDNLQFYPSFSLFSTLGGMNLDHNFVQVSKLSENHKKRSSSKMEHFFPQIRVKTKKKKKKKNKKVFTEKGTLFSPEFEWTPTLRCTPEQIIGRMQMYTIQYSNYWGGYSQIIGGDISSPGFGTPVSSERLLVAYC